MNTYNESPTSFEVVQSDSTIYEPPLYGLIVWAPGDLSYKNERGSTITRTFPAVAAGGYYPVAFITKIRQVLDTSTTLTDAQILGLR